MATFFGEDMVTCSCANAEFSELRGELGQEVEASAGTTTVESCEAAHIGFEVSTITESLLWRKAHFREAPV